MQTVEGQADVVSPVSLDALVVERPPVVINAEAFKQALQQQSSRELGAAFAHRCLTVLMWLGPAFVLLLMLCGALLWKLNTAEVKYFTTEGGRVVRVFPLDQPGFDLKDVAAFGADTIRESFNLDFVHYRDQTTAVSDRYSEQGYVDYYKALASSNVFAAVKGQRMNLSVDVGPGVIHSKGAPGGVYTWEFQYPVTLKLDGQQSSNAAQRFIFTQRIQQVDARVKNKGLEVTQIITSSN